jgi:hypothetical protein
MIPISAEVMANTDFFQEFLRIVIQKNSKIPNFLDNEQNDTKLQLSSLYIAEAMDIPAFFSRVFVNYSRKLQKSKF